MESVYRAQSLNKNSALELEEKSIPGCSISFVIPPFQDGEEVNGNDSHHEEAAKQQQDCDMIEQQPQNLPTNEYQNNHSSFSRAKLMEFATISGQLTCGILRKGNKLLHRKNETI
ncbi:unnamed protein product [Orchesella dallaii]|uniref:Uncharacterized protein n=1 Tax=Orchesella dallaii TaxID=48710 RepID=A0ABP1PVN2_9HEXA